jgi:predicted outer membrane repeat protein
MLKLRLASVAFASALIGAIAIAPAPVRAVAGEDFYISDNAAAASVGVGTGCALPDVQYVEVDGLEDALAAIYEDDDYGDDGDTIILCDIDADAGDVDYLMHDDVGIDDDDDAGTPDAATYDAVDGAAAINLTIRGNAEDADSIIIDADDNDGEDDGGYSPFDFTDTHLTIRNMTILNAWDDSEGAGIHHIQGDATDTVTLTLDTVVIEYAYAQGNGAGVYSGGDVDVYDSIFEDNSFGAAEYNGAAIYAAGDVSAENSEFLNNESTSDGGAIYAVNVTVTSSDFYNNEAVYDGGAIYAQNAYIYTSHFELNGADDDGGAVYAQNDATIEESTFTDNYAPDDGGAVYVDDDLEVIDSEFNDNEADDGGAIYVDEEDVDISGTSFIRNSALDDGGALYHDDDDEDSPIVNIIDCVFKDNEAGDDGGALSLRWSIDLLADSLFSGNRANQNDDEFAGDGGALMSENGIIDEDEDGYSGIHNNVFSENEASNGGVLWLDEIDQSDEIVGNRFINNLATEDGGGIWMTDYGDNGELIKFTQNIFTANRADGMGGGVYMDLFEAIALPNTTTFSRNKFTRNVSTWGGGITINGLDECESTPISTRQVARNLRSNKFSKNRGGGSRNANVAIYCSAAFE